MVAYVNDFRTSGDAWYWNAGNTTKTENIKESRLTFDYGLEEIAMQRAAEIAASFSHTRPNGTPCFTCLSSNGGCGRKKVRIMKDRGTEEICLVIIRQSVLPVLM